MNKREEILTAANKVVNGERDKQYGNPEDNFGIIADLWSIYLDEKIEAKDVAMMMALLKIARIRSGKYKDDNYIDLAGYAACGAEVEYREDAEKEFRATDKGKCSGCMYVLCDDCEVERDACDGECPCTECEGFDKFKPKKGE